MSRPYEVGEPQQISGFRAEYNIWQGNTVALHVEVVNGGRHASPIAGGTTLSASHNGVSHEDTIRPPISDQAKLNVQLGKFAAYVIGA